MEKIALAIGCHPDDIEFMMSGTLFLLRRAGWSLHYVNLANGSCGTDRTPARRLVRMRRDEARRAASLVGAVFHESMVNDLEVFYEQDLIRRVTGLVREVQPSIILTQSLEDYMEDHTTTARVVVTASFCRGMRNYRSIPARPPVRHDVLIYHATPHTLTDPMRRPITPELYVDIGTVLQSKLEMLACHRSQQEWLDHSQSMGSCLSAMEQTAEAVGRMSGRFRHAEGWRRHSHVGFTAKDGDPLAAALGPGLVAGRAGPAVGAAGAPVESPA